MIDLLSEFESQAQRASGRPSLEVGLVTAAPSGGRVMVNSSGATENVSLAQYLDVTVADRVLIAREGAAAWVVAKVGGRSLPPKGTVTSAPPGSQITVSAAGVSYTLPFLGSYTPVVNDSVAIMWGASGEGGVVLGKCGTIAAPAAPAAPSTPPPPPPMASSGTARISATDSCQYRGGQWGAAGDRNVYQGNWGWGDNTGAWFYGNTPHDTLAGRTITGLRVRVSRRSGGVYGAQAAHLYRHTSTSRPGGDVSRVDGPTDVSIGIGESAWVNLPAAWGQAIVDSGGGIGVAGSPYVVLNGIDADPESGLLELDWRA